MGANTCGREHLKSRPNAFGNYMISHKNKRSKMAAKRMSSIFIVGIKPLQSWQVVKHGYVLSHFFEFELFCCYNLLLSVYSSISP